MCSSGWVRTMANSVEVKVRDLQDLKHFTFSTLTIANGGF